MAVLKFPPPPTLTDPKFQALNRWLIELQSILNSSGLIDPTSVEDLPQTIAQVATLNGEVATLNGEVATLNGEVATLNGEVATLNSEVATLNSEVATLNGEVATLQARSQVLNGIVAPATGLGNVGDWYADTVGLHIYVKTGVATWTLII